MKAEKRSGFRYIVLILSVVLVGALGVLLWRIFSIAPAVTQHRHDTPTDPNTGYVVIKEWGIRFKPVEGLNDVTHTTGELSGTEGMTVFSTESLAKYGEVCSAAQQSATPLGRLMRVEGNKDVTPSMNVAFAVQIGSYNYLYSTPQAICSEDKAAIKLQTDQLKLFKNSITSLETVQ